jgi:hypothetical protein
MANVIEKFSEDGNFWKANPEFLFIKEFKEFQKNDKSKNKLRSSKIMWALAFLLELDNNKLAKYPEDERRELILNEFIRDPHFKWDDYKDIEESYRKLILTPEERALIAQRAKTDERTKFLLSVPYTLENAKEIDALLANTEKFLTILKKLEDSVEKAKNSGNKRGGREESLSEKGLI